MKRFLKLFLFVVSLFVFSSKQVKADVTGRSVTFSIPNTSYYSVNRTYENGNTVFDINYVSNLNNLTDAQLNDILGQKINTSNDLLTVYGEMKINVTPVVGSTYNPIVNKTNIYRANGLGKYTTDINASIDTPNVAAKTTFNETVYPVVAKIYYKTSAEGEWIHTPIDAVENEKISDYLARLLSINLTENPTGLVDAYKTSYYFKPITDGNYYLNKYQFYDDGNKTISANGEGYYNLSDLDKLGEEKVIIKYHGSDSASTFLESDNQNSSWIYIISILSMMGLGYLGYIKKEDIKKWLK